MRITISQLLSDIDFYGADFSSPMRVCGRDGGKLERVSTLAARWVAKSLVASQLCKRCHVSISYASSFAEPVHVNVESYGSSKSSNEKLRQLVLSNFDLRIGSVGKELDLSGQEFALSALYGYFGGFETDGSWEKPRTLTP